MGVFPVPTHNDRGTVALLKTPASKAYRSTLIAGVKNGLRSLVL